MSFVHHSYTDIKSVGNEFNKTADEQQHLRGSGEKNCINRNIWIFRENVIYSGVGRMGYANNTAAIEEW